MAKQNTPRRSAGMSYEQRRLRWQRIFFVVLAVVLIISWIASLIIII